MTLSPTSIKRVTFQNLSNSRETVILKIVMTYLKCTLKTSALLIALMLVGCRPAIQHTYQPPAASSVSNAKLIFLTFTVTTDSNGNNNVQLVSKKETDGNIKVNQQLENPLKYMIVSLLSQEHTVLEEQIVEHPLYKEVEYTNDKKEFERKALNLKEAEFFVRMKLPEAAAFVTVTEVIEKNKVNSVEFNLK